jgi:hypothetical protein
MAVLRSALLCCSQQKNAACVFLPALQKAGKGIRLEFKRRVTNSIEFLR